MADLTISVDIDSRGTKTGAAETRLALRGIGDEVQSTGRKVASVAGRDFKTLETQLKAISSMSTLLGTALGSLAGQAVSFLTREMVSGVSAILDYSSKLEQARIGFETMTGSAVIAERHLKELQTFAQTTPFQFDELVDASQKLQGVGFAAKDIIPILTDVGNALSAAGRIKDLPFAVKALGDIKAKGQLAGQEIIQLANAGIPIRQVLARDLNVTTAQLIKMGEQGQISADQVFAALHHMSSERFGGAMEKQSKTFSGAMSNITDALQITASTAFKPLYARISRLAVDFGTEISKQQGDLHAVGAVIGQYIGVGLNESLAAAAATTGSSLYNAFKDSFERGAKHQGLFQKGDITWELLNGLTGGDVASGRLASPLFDPAPKINLSIADLRKLDDALGGFKEHVAKIPSVANQLELDKAKKQAEDLKSVTDDLTSRIAFFGQTSQIAATKQKLINSGIFEFTKGAGQNAVALAGTLDRLEALKKKSDEYNETLKTARAYLKQARDDANFEIRFPKATDLEKFDRWVKDNAQDFRELNREIAATRDTIKDTQIIAGIRKSSKGIADTIQEISGAAAGANFDELNQKLRDIGKTLMGEGLQISTPESFAVNMRKFIDAVAGSTSLDQINQAKIQWKDFLLLFNDPNGKGFFGDKTEVYDFITALIALGNAAKTDIGADYLGGLNSELAELQEQLRTGAEVTAVFRASQELLKGTYKAISDDTRKLIMATAAQTDAARAAIKAQEEMKRRYDDFYHTIRDSLGVLAEDGFGAFFKNIYHRFKSFLIDMAAQWLTSKFFHLFYQGGNPQPSLAGAQGSSGGGVLGGFLGNILNGGQISGNGPGGTPYFNPNAAGIGGNNAASGNWSDEYLNLWRNGALNNNPASAGHGPAGGTGYNKAGIGGLAGIFSGGLGNLLKGLAGGLPVAGLGIGQALGGGGLTGILGGAGGLLLGLGGLGLAAPTALGGILGGLGLSPALGALFTNPFTIAIGAAALIGSYFIKRNMLRRKEETIRNQGILDAFEQLKGLDTIIADVRGLRLDPASGIAQATSLGQQVREQYLQMANALKDKKTRSHALQDVSRIDLIISQKMAELKAAGDIAFAAGDRDRRLIPEFAKGVYMSPAFQNFRRMNGMIPGAWTGQDVIPAMLARREMVINPDQQAAIIRNAGFDVLKTAGIPGYGGIDVAKTAGIQGYASGGVINQSTVVSSQPIVNDINVTVMVEQDSAGVWRANAESDNGTRVITEVVQKQLHYRELTIHPSNIKR